MPLPPEYNSQHGGAAIVLGRAPGWFEDLDEALTRTRCDAPIFSVNGGYPDHYGGVYPVDHVVSTHCHAFPPNRSGTLYHSNKPVASCANVDVRWPLCHIAGTGSSALLATAIALLMGFDRVVVVGVSLTGRVETKIDGKTVFHDYAFFRQGWHDAFDVLYGRVVSASDGFLKKLFGGF